MKQNLATAPVCSPSTTGREVIGIDLGDRWSCDGRASKLHISIDFHNAAATGATAITWNHQIQRISTNGELWFGIQVLGSKVVLGTLLLIRIGDTRRPWPCFAFKRPVESSKDLLHEFQVVFRVEALNVIPNGIQGELCRGNGITIAGHCVANSFGEAQAGTLAEPRIEIVTKSFSMRAFGLGER